MRLTPSFAKAVYRCPVFSTSISANTKPCAKTMSHSNPCALCFALVKITTTGYIRRTIARYTNANHGYDARSEAAAPAAEIYSSAYMVGVCLGVSPSRLNSEAEPEHTKSQSYSFCAAIFRLPISNQNLGSIRYDNSW